VIKNPMENDDFKWFQPKTRQLINVSNFESHALACSKPILLKEFCLINPMFSSIKTKRATRPKFLCPKTISTTIARAFHEGTTPEPIWIEKFHHTDPTVLRIQEGHSIDRFFPNVRSSRRLRVN
jgi:hypothetical protein